MSGSRRSSAGSPRSSPLESVAGFLVRRARLVVAVWILVVVALGAIGSGLDRKLTLHQIFVEGTQSKEAHDIAVREFGSEHAMIVLLRGPKIAVDRQGERLAERLGETEGMLVVSPWSPGAAVEGLRPGPRAAALVVRVESNFARDVSELMPPLERQVEQTVREPVRSSIAGFPAIITSLRSANEHSTKVGEAIAIPVLLLVLLLVFRSVLAALMPVVIGATVVAASRGVLDLMLGFVELDLFVVAVVSMMGLALGVDYSLLVVSRFREERRRAGVAEAAQATMVATSRSVIPAGTGLLLAMVVAAMVLSGTVSASVAIAVGVSTVLSVVSALCVVPALLTVLGDNLDRWAMPRRDGAQVAPLLWSRRVLDHPRAIAAFVLVLVFLSGWAFTLDTGAPGAASLPAGDPGREQQEDVERALGPGWTAPMEVVVDGSGPIAAPERLRALADFQRRVERVPGVASMAGFARIERGTRELDGIEEGLADQERGLERLDKGISRVHGGARLNTSGLRKAAAGAGLLTVGAGRAAEGAGLLSDSLQTVSAGSAQLSDGLDQADEGSGQLAEGASKATGGAGRLADGLAKAAEQSGEIEGTARLLQNAMRSGDERLGELHAPLRSTEDQLGAAWQALQEMTAGRADPTYASAVRAVEEAKRSLSGKDVRSGEQLDPSYAGVEAGVERAEGQFDVGLYLSEKLGKNGEQAEEGIGKLADGAAKLDRGLRRLSAGSDRLAEGLAQLSQGGEKLPPGLARLGDGAERLAVGLAQLESGTGQLADGLGGGAQKSTLLSGALRRIDQGLERQQGGDGISLAQLNERSPGLFRSGYFTLATLDGSPPARREQLGFLVNLDRGGEDARMLVIPRDDALSSGARATKERLEEEAAGLARRTGTEVAVGGVAPTAIDVSDALLDQSLVLRLALSLVSFLVLVPVVRSLTLPLIAALLNLLTVSAAFGVLALLFDGSLLGGPGYVDTTVVPATMIVMFGLAIDYEVFVFARIREEYLRTGSTSEAVRNGLDRTAPVVTGAAVIMIAVFLAFSLASLATIRNFGVAQSIGVFIDAFIVRLVVIPAVMNRLGELSWWMPRWLDRILPGGGAPAAALEPAGEPA